MATALYMAHLNPLTTAHAEIIGELLDEADNVTVMPVVFAKAGSEVNSRSFPFTYEAREEMIRAVFGQKVGVSKDYAFCAPYVKYLPPLLSPFSWMLRRKVLQHVSGDYFTYTGDAREGQMLGAYRMRPRVGKRKGVSATSVRDGMYEDMSGSWRDCVPKEALQVIDKNAATVLKYAGLPDHTKRVAGMKFPREGYWPGK